MKEADVPVAQTLFLYPPENQYDTQTCLSYTTVCKNSSEENQKKCKMLKKV